MTHIMYLPEWWRHLFSTTLAFRSTMFSNNNAFSLCFIWATRVLFRYILFDRIYFILENYDYFRGLYICFSDPQDGNYKRSWARHVLLFVCILILTNIINDDSGLFKEDPIERVHIYNTHLERLFASLKKKDVCSLPTNRILK